MRTDRFTQRATEAIVNAQQLAEAEGHPELTVAHLALVLVEQLHPVGQPARGAGDGEEHREHLEGEAHGLVDEARVEVDVG
jgi:ATP-dependent Clp protease ATP-binding subunit ClpA